MKIKFEIIPARPYHCGQMVRRLRRDHTRAMMMAGLDPHTELRARFYESAYVKCWIIDGELAAMGGVTGSVVASSGQIWLALSERAMRYPKAVIEEARRQIEVIMATRQVVFTGLLEGDDAARRFAVFLGFRCEGNQAYSRSGRRDAMRAIETIPDFRVPIGGSFAVTVGYQEGAI